MTQSQPTPPITIRPATPKDLPAIGNLGATVFATTFGYSLPPSDLEAYLTTAYSPQALTADLENDLITILVGCSQDTVVGFAYLTRPSPSTVPEPSLAGKEKPVELQRLYVSKEFHGRGVGRMLGDAVERIAKEEGYKTFWLGVWEENLKAQKVYGKLGFGKCGEHDFTMGQCVQTDWIMSKAL